MELISILAASWCLCVVFLLERVQTYSHEIRNYPRPLEGQVTVCLSQAPPQAGVSHREGKNKDKMKLKRYNAL